MTMTDVTPFPLPEPPDSPLRGAPWPRTEPPLVDQDPPDWEEAVDQWEPFASDPIDPDLPQDDVDRARDAALNDGRVREVIGDGRITDFGASGIGDKGDGEPELLRYLLFSCDTLRSADVVLDRATMAVLEVTSPEGQPAPLPEEITLAVTLAANELGVVPDAALVGRAIFVTREDPNDPLFRHRLADVRFGRPEERRPLLRALVDVCDERVLESGNL
jgi:hypothetical protein